MAQIREHLAALEEGTEPNVIDVYGLTFPTPYPTNRPTAPPIEPAISCILWFGRNWPAITSAAEIANNRTAATRTASSDLLFSGLPVGPPPVGPPRLMGGVPAGGFIASSSHSMRLISFSGSD